MLNPSHSSSRLLAAVVRASIYPVPTPVHSSALTASFRPPSQQILYGPSGRPIDLTFNDSQVAYRQKSHAELSRAFLVLNCLSFKSFVSHHKELLALSRRLLGARLFRALMRSTFFGHFVAGENAQEVAPVVARLHSGGVRAILDYAAESDIHSSPATDTRPQAETQTAAASVPAEEAHLERNLEKLLESIAAVACADRAAHAASSAHAQRILPFAAFKLTAIAPPRLLKDLSRLLLELDAQYERLAADRKGISPERFVAAILERSALSRQAAVEWFERLDTTRDGILDTLDWCPPTNDRLALAALLKCRPLESAATLSSDELQRVLRRLHTLAKMCSEKRVRLMVDAEQSYFQPAINALTLDLMRQFNRGPDGALVLNTYQCYLKAALQWVNTDLELSEREQFHFGAKLVRGAYMEQERLLARKEGRPDPINDSFESTSHMFDQVSDRTLRAVATRPRGAVNVMFATHNEASVRQALIKMEQLKLTEETEHITFGQLYGMCDYLTFPLADAGYAAFKYIPYGPLHEVLPYLGRRASENSAAFAKAQKEKRLLTHELLARAALRDVFWPRARPALASSAAGAHRPSRPIGASTYDPQHPLQHSAHVGK